MATSTQLLTTTTNVFTNTTIPVPDEPDKQPEIVEAIFYTVLMVASFVANIVAIMTILKTKSLRNNHHNLLIINLNIIDLGITLLSMTFSVGSFFDGGAYLKENYALCRFNGFFAMTFTVGNFTTTFCIAIDRYLTVVWSTRFPPTRRRVLVLLAYSWIVAIIFAIFPTAEILSRFVYTPSTHHCSPAWDVCAYYIAWFVHIYGLIVPVMAICYAFVFRAIHQQGKNLRSHELGLRKTTVLSPSNIESKTKDEISESTSDSKEAKKNTKRHVVVQNQAQEPSGPVSTSGVYSQDEVGADQVRVTTVHENKECNGSVQAESSLSRSASQSESTAGVQDCRIGKNLKKKLSFKKDRGVKSALEDRPSSSYLDYQVGENTISSMVDEAATLKKRKERRRKIKLQNLSVDKQVALTGVLLVLTTVICWTPYNIIHSCFLNINLSHPVESLTMLIGYLNALLDPLIYTFMNRKARAARKEYARSYKNEFADFCNRCAHRVSNLRTRVSGGLTYMREYIANACHRRDTT